MAAVAINVGRNTASLNRTARNRSTFSAGRVHDLGHGLDQVFEGGSLFTLDVDLCRHTRLQLDVLRLAQ